jgi:protein-S-isoprenylcysteine O-methyltransferase Ste14
MHTDFRTFFGKLVYGVVFLCFLPLLMWFWAINTTDAIFLPVVQSTTSGTLLIMLGFILMLTGMYGLWKFGKGLPMNGYPPEHFVSEGVFRLVPHPIYLGFCVATLGFSILYGSSAGFWFITPIAVLSCLALVWGYERLDLKIRFPTVDPVYYLALPPSAQSTPRLQDRLSVYLLLVAPWVLSQWVLLWLNSAKGLPEPLVFWYTDYLNLYLMWYVGGLPILWALLSPLFAKSQSDLRQFISSGAIASGVIVYLQIVVPSFGLAHISTFHTPIWKQAVYALPWFWVWIAGRIYWTKWPRFFAGIAFIAVLLSICSILLSNDPVADTITGAVACFFAFRYTYIWSFLRGMTEKVANSWKEWRFGPVRVINHGFYVGFGAFVGTLIGGSLVGEKYGFAIVVFGVIVTICAGIWGQLVEGSDKLKRPFGFYGAMLGIVLASFVMHRMGIEVWVMLGIFSVFMPWVQGIGRLRCLVNGCCHGAEANDAMGIRYFHHRSRVCFLSHLRGQPLHPTQLYSMIWLALVGGLQVRLWLEGAEYSMIFGMYLILNGLGRFVEEAYRGEPQTPVWAKLRLYQWAAIASVLVGIAVTMFRTSHAGQVDHLTWRIVGFGLLNWIFVQFMMGVDFPASRWRFSRLT